MRKLFYLLVLYKDTSSRVYPISHGPFSEADAEVEINNLRAAEPDADIVQCEITYNYGPDENTDIPVLNTSVIRPN